MFSKTAILALRAAVALARRPGGGPCGAADLAREIGAPQNYLGKLLQLLAREGVVESQKGHGGGFRLAKPSRDVTLYEVVEPIDRVSRRVGCLLGQLLCSDRSACPLHAAWGDVQERYLRLLKGTSLADVVGGAADPAGGCRARRRDAKKTTMARRAACHDTGLEQGGL